MTKENQAPIAGKIEPKTEQKENKAAVSNTNIYAEVAQYTQRPDLFIAEVEKHDPGFIKRMNNIAEKDAEKESNIRYRFGKHQAYTGLVLQVIATLGLFGLGVGLLWTGKLGFSAFCGMAIFYGVVQSGFEGFIEIGRGVAKAILLKTSDKDK